jgi:RecA/RadA recombinase
MKKAMKTLEEGTKPKETSRLYLSLGCPLLNLAVSGDWRKGMIAGTYCFYVGDSSSGKTLATLSMLAEAANDPNFDEYELWHINGEVGSFFDFEVFFGSKAAKRIQVMTPSNGQPMLLEKVYDFLDKKLSEGKKIVAVLDSMDSFSTESREELIQENAKRREQGKDTQGSYGDGKAKLNSERLPRLVQGIEQSGSIVVSISQTRDNIGGGPYAPAKTRSGGHAIKFYASLEIWTSPGKVITKEYKGKDRTIGIKPVFRIKKNRINGKERTVTIPILPDFGIDALGAAVDYLIEENAWTVSGGRIVSDLYDKSYHREVLVSKIEEDNRETELFDKMQAVWDDIENAIRIERKKRYS